MQLIDRAIVAVGRWPKFWAKLAHPMQDFLVNLRVKQIAVILQTRCIQLPEVHYSLLTKHGQNVVYVPCIKNSNSAWVVDYLNNTFRRVKDLPEDLKQVGASF